MKIECNRHPYVCNLEFKLKPFFGGSMNVVKGSINKGKETVATIQGRWDGEITLNEDVYYFCVFAFPEIGFSYFFYSFVCS